MEIIPKSSLMPVVILKQLYKSYSWFILLLLCLSLSVSAQRTLVSAEYFFNQDPGFGMGVPISVASAETWTNIPVSINTNTLPAGLHQAYLRVRDNAGHYSITNRFFFYKAEISQSNISNIVAAEYFFDNDPGFGSGQPINITPVTVIADKTFSANTEQLSSGIHQFYIRVKDAFGKWSICNRTFFYKPSNIITATVQVPNITQAEYFFDTDPGFGQGNSIAITPGIQILDKTFQANTEALGGGIHQFYIRVKDANGRWSTTNRTFFYKPVSISTAETVKPKIIMAEYFFDADPGFGRGNSISITPGIQVLDHAFEADVTSLPSGLHQMYVRVMDSLGSWSISNRTFFYKQPALDSGASIQTAKIVQLEYYIDTDPGFGLAIPCPIPANASHVDSTLLINLGNLSVGDHKLYIRARDNYGKWSVTNVHAFTVSTQPEQQVITIAGVNKRNLCAGDTLLIGYHATGSYASGNQFSVQLSDVNGSFGVALEIGSLASTGSGSIKAVVPAGLINGSQYRIRILSSTPSVIGIPMNALFYTDCINTTPPTIQLISKQDLLCGSNPNGSINIGVSGGTLPYTFSWKKLGSPLFSANTKDLTNLTSGSYQLTVRDSLGLESAFVVQINGPALLKANAYAAPVNCNGASTGGVTVTAIGGVAPYTFLWSNGSTSNSLQNVTAGLYEVTVTDLNGCTTTSQTTLAEPIAIQLAKTFSNAVCEGTSSGSAAVTVTGGNTPYRYSWSNGISTSFNNNLNAGTYRISVTDSFGCIKTDSITIGFTHPKPAISITTPAIVELCQGSSTTLNSSLTSGNIWSNGLTSSSINVNSGGIYTVSTTSSQGCINTSDPVQVILKPSTSGVFAPISSIAFGVTAPVLPTVSQNGIEGTWSPALVSNTQSGSYTFTPSSGSCIVPTQITIQVISAPDVAVQGVVSDVVSAKPGDTAIVSWQVANVGAIGSPIQWVERIYMQSASGENRSLLKQSSFENNGIILPGQSLSRNQTIVFPGTLNIGAEGVFVVEIIPGSSVQEMSGTSENNIGIQSSTWTIQRMLICQLSSSQILEGAPQGMSVSVFRTGSITDSLIVSVGVKKMGRYSIPSTIKIPAGQAGRAFLITAPDNNNLEGLLSDTLFVQANEYGYAEQYFTLQDNEMPTLSITGLPSEIIEGIAVNFQVGTNLTPTSALTVYLSSSNQSRFSLPASVLIPAGQSEITVTVNLPQDIIPEINQPIQINAGANGHIATSATSLMKDDDVPGLELDIQAQLISESAGYFATQATLRRTANGNPIAFTANLSASLPNTLILPAGITLQANENEKTFTIGVIDNALVDSIRNVIITASVFVNSCGCNAQVNDAGFVTDSLKVSDNDGPSLQITSNPITLVEGSNNAGMLRVSRNTSVLYSQTVQLVSSDTNELQLPFTVTIPAGSAFLDLPIKTINDGLSDGSKQVNIQANADGFSSGAIWVLVTDLNKPDLQIPSVQIPSQSIAANQILNYQFGVKNTGFATAISGVIVKGYLSIDGQLDANTDILFSEDTIQVPIVAGQTQTIINAKLLPNIPGSYSLIYQVNPSLLLSELLYNNNTSSPVSINILPSYTATAMVDENYFLRGDTIMVHGMATENNGSAAANKNIEVYVITNGLRRTIQTITDQSGNFFASFIPLANEYGHYTIGAAFPGLGITQEQDQFDILGVRINQSIVPQFPVIIGDTLTGTLQVENMSPTDLHHFTLQAAQLSEVTFVFDTIDVLSGGGTIMLPYKAIGNSVTQGLNYSETEFKVTADEGQLQKQRAFYFCQAPNGFLISNISSIQMSVSSATTERLVECILVNTGIGSTGNVQVNIPQTSWLSLVTPSVIPNLNRGDSARVIFRFIATPEVPFNYPITGNIVIQAQQGNAIQLPFTYEKSASSIGAVRVDVSNQFTYTTNSGPKVKDAHVTIKNYFTGVVYGDGYTDSNGIFMAVNLPEGIHRIIVEKDHHLPFNGSVSVNPGDTVDKAVFINYQAITFSWSVVPTAVQDQYNIVLVTQFETHIPIPVVTIDVPDTMPQLAINEEYAFNAILTNHGLIRAQNVSLNFPTEDEEYEFVTNYVTADLNAQQSIQVPVIMRRRTQPLNRTSSISVEGISRYLGMNQSAYSAYTSRSLSCSDFVPISYGYPCSMSNSISETGGKMFTYGGRNCSGSGIDVYIPVYTITGASGQGINNVPCFICEGIPGPGSGNVPAYQVENKSCQQCVNDVIGAAAGCGTGNAAAVVGTATCITGNLLGSGSKLKDYIQCIPGVIPGPIGCAKGIVDAIMTCTSAFLGSLNGGSNGGTVSGGSGRGNAPLGAVYVQIANNLQAVLDAYAVREDWASVYFGNMIHSNAWDYLSTMLTPYISNVDSIPNAAQDSIINAMAGYEIQGDTIRSFFDRWHVSLHALSLDIHEPNAQYPNIINWTFAKQCADSIRSSNANAIELGYIDLNDMFNKQISDLNEIIMAQNGQAVCASVKVQFSQQLTMTREAFEGTLDIFNGHPTDAMDSLTVNISIKNSNGEPSNGFFEIQTQSLNNLSDVTGTGMIPAQQRGIVKFLFIPEVGAAPTTPLVYQFGGSVSYWDPYVGEMVTLPLNDIPIIVNPSPYLNLHYFMERNILSDDALTLNTIEPTIPAELAVMIENQGYGPAVNVTISSSQPEIIENESGLAIQFNLIGSNFQGQPTNLGMNNINFGTIPPLQTRIGQWYFTSSLLGKFVNYESNVVHANSFGNPELSLIKDIALHELTRSVKVYGTSDDQIKDFLVNDLFDPYDRPDVLYYSQGNKTAEVHQASSGTFSSPVSAPSFTNTLVVAPSDSGWNYIKLNDPGNGQYELISVTRNDGQIIPLDNVWLTFVTLPISRRPVYENKFHFLDSFPALQSASYVLVWRPKNINVPNITRIDGINQLVTSNQVQNLQVVFDKPIDASTFTYEDITLYFQGGSNLINSTNARITQIDSVRFNVDLSDITTGNGFYNFIAQAAQIKDIYGISGTSGKNKTWTQFLTIPTVQSYLVPPNGPTDSAIQNVQVLFNLIVDSATTSADKFAIHKDGVELAGNLVIDSIGSDKKTYYISGMNDLLNQDGDYHLVVKLPEIQSEDQIFGLIADSLKLTIDKTGPRIAAFEKSNVGGIDAQHIPNVRIQFNEDVFGFNTASMSLTRNGEVLPIVYTQLSNTDLKNWTAGNFGLLTYPEGEYSLKVYYELIKDQIGNNNLDSQQISWTVNRSASSIVSNLVVSPDYGYSNTDGVTSEKNINVQFEVLDSATQIKIIQTDPSGESTLRILYNVAPGIQSVSCRLLIGGNTGIKVIAFDTNSNFGIVEKNLFVDEVPLSARWIPLASTQSNNQIDSLTLIFNAQPLDTSGLMNALVFTRNNQVLSKQGLQIVQLNDSAFRLYGISSINASEGIYKMLVPTSVFKKYSSGKSGFNPASIEWEWINANSIPIANAGDDTTIYRPGLISLNGSASYDANLDSLQYRWVVPAGLQMSDTLTKFPKLQIMPSNNGQTYAVMLIVNDGQSISTDLVQVHVQFSDSVIYYNGLLSS
ncbi:MAG: hypothetical protein RL582_978, partial [Bacteroidota bacterium]